MPVYLHEYTVLGHLNFPVDMLRYDSSYPADSEAVSNITLSDSREYRKAYKEEHQVEPIFQVTLKHLDDNKLWRPTRGRWESFGWRMKYGIHAVRKI